MVFYCRCFSFLEEGEEATECETRTQTKSSTTFYTATSDLNRYAYSSHARASEFPNLADKPNNLRVFTVEELKVATENFCMTSKIGEGVFGTVYKGVVKRLEHPFDEIQVAVKLAKRLFQGHGWLVREINVLGKVEHPNLVKLIGYCAVDDEREEGAQLFFVYEYMVNKSVRDHLSSKSETPLSWDMRLKLAQDAARVLTYLHEEMEFQMIFKNFKSSNVLLDGQWNTKLSDFGVPQILGPDGRRVTHISNKLVGSMEYAAPEYIYIGHLTSKGDVWCYGIFLYELLTGQHPLALIRGQHGSGQKQPLNERMLLKWVKPYLGSKRFKQIVDLRIDGNYPLNSAQQLCIIANKCLSENPKSRPKMSEVLDMVSQLIRVPSQATGPASPWVAVDPTESEMTNEVTRHEIRKSKPACGPHIHPLKLLKSCFKK